KVDVSMGSGWWSNPEWSAATGRARAKSDSIREKMATVATTNVFVEAVVDRMDECVTADRPPYLCDVVVALPGGGARTERGTADGTPVECGTMQVRYHGTGHD
ncbi:MAG TPA: hypothetical protein VFP30_01395, partial [Candidatus Limnocylindria bacterium]|nr:hypothetical protein [Candidatus Limnocylindria bacterium]